MSVGDAMHNVRTMLSTARLALFLHALVVLHDATR